MRGKSIRFSEKYPSIASLIAASIWILVLVLSSTGLSKIPFLASPDSGYLGQFMVDLVGTGVSVYAIWFLNMGNVIKEKRYGIGKGFVIGMYILAMSLFSLTVTTIGADKSNISPVWKIMIFVLTMFLIGAAEELMFRGVVSNLLFAKYGMSRQGVWFSVLLTGIIFGAVHLLNAISPEVSFYSALIQGIVAGGLGMVLTAIYYRCKNILVVILLHGIIDLAGLFTSGIFGANTLGGTIGSYSSLQLFGLIPYSIVLLVLLRKSKMEEILEKPVDKAPTGETKRLVITVAGYFLVIVIAFFAGLGSMVEMFKEQMEAAQLKSQGFKIESFSGTYIEKDLSEIITLKEDGSYLTGMKADKVSKGTIIGMIFSDENQKVYISNLSDSCHVAEKLELKAGNYFCKMIMISSLEQYQDFLSTNDFEVSKEEDANFRKIIESKGKEQSSAEFSFVMTQIRRW